MAEKDLQSTVISILRFPLIAGVVLAHSRYMDGSDGGMAIVGGERLPIYTYLSFYLSDILARIPSRLFFFISGFLFFRTGEFSRSVYLQKLKRRIKTLLIPYVFWNAAVMAIYAAAQAALPGAIGGKAICDFSPRDFLCAFWDMSMVNPGAPSFPICYQLWFVRDLMVMAVLSPLIYWLVKRGGVYFIAIMVGMQMSQLFPTLSGLVLSDLIYFAGGAYFSIHGKDFTAVMKPTVPVAAALYAVFSIVELALLGEGALGSVLHLINIITGIFLVVGVTARMAEKGRWRQAESLSSSSFFVYASHGVVLAAIIELGVRLLHPHTELSAIAVYLLSPTATICICIVCYKILKRVMPRFTAIVTGERVKY